MLTAASLFSLRLHAGIVTSAADDGTPGTLRAEMAAAAPGDTITFDPSLTGQIIGLTLGQLVIDKDLTIAGLGEARLTIFGAQENFSSPASRVFFVNSGVTATIQDVRIAAGFADRSSGGGIFNNGGTLTVSRCKLEVNRATGSVGGGGGIVNNGGTLTVSYCTLSGNASTGGGSGGGIFNSGGTLTVSYCTLRENGSTGDGGGIVNFGGKVTVSNCTLRENGSTGGGGGIANAFGTLTVSDCMLLRNGGLNGGGIFNAGQLTVNRCTVEGNQATGSGGGIISAGGIVAIRDSTLVGNSAGLNGGGIHNQSGVVLNNSTVSGNSASSGGGGIYNYFNAAVTILNSTVSANSASTGGGIENYFGTVNIKNCIVANSLSGGDCANNGTFTVAGVNFDTDGTCPDFTLVTSSDLNLGPLADNGGPTMTHALLPGSVAIDTATDCIDFDGNPVFTDQRGVARWQGSACDVGAYEMGSITLTLNGSSRVSMVCGFDFTDPGATAVDADGNSLEVKVTGTVDTSTPGTYTLTYAATDAAGHIARVIRIVDVAGPIIVNVYSGFSRSGGGAPYSHWVGEFLATDVNFAANNNYSWHPFGLPAFGADIRGALQVQSTGTYTFSLDSDDGALLFIDGNLVVDNGGIHAAHTVSASANLTAGRHCFEIQFFNADFFGGFSGVNLHLPDGVSYACSGLNCPTDVTVATDAGLCGANVSFAPPTHCLGLTVLCSATPGSFFPVGSTPVTCQAIDAGGLVVAQCSFNVIVIGDRPPTIVTCPADAIIECPATPTFGIPQFSDACDNNLTATSADTALPVTGKEIIKTRRSWTAMNHAGNSVSCSQTITVMDTTAPVISCPANLTVTTTSASGMKMTYPAATASDNCSTPAITYSKASGSIFNLGTTTVTATATDASGNRAQCSFKVNVVCSWSGVLQPINADGSSVFKLGTTVQVKFQLTGASAGIANAVARLSYTRLPISIPPDPVNEATSTAAATSGNLFRYDAKTKQYVFNWGTKGLTAGTYELKIDLGDGVSRTVNVVLK